MNKYKKALIAVALTLVIISVIVSGVVFFPQTTMIAWAGFMVGLMIVSIYKGIDSYTKKD